MKAIVDRRRRRYAQYLTGRGLEIGALGNPMPLPHASEVLYSDVLLPEQVDAMYPGSRHPDIISDSERFDGVADGEFDFVVANHVLEHVTDPIGRNECHLLEWAEHVERLTPGSAAFEEWVAEQRRRGFAVHNHVWVLQDVLELLEHLPVSFRLVRWNNTSFLGNEFNLLRKAEGDPRMRVARIATIAAHPLHELISRLRRYGVRRQSPPL